MFRIVVINPGSTSTKVAVFDSERVVAEVDLRHEAEELKKYSRVKDQLEFRLQVVLSALHGMGFDPGDFHAAVGRGGLIKPVAGGTYRVNGRMLEDAERGLQGQHPANLGASLADGIARMGGAQSFVVDPISVDEFEPLARYSGHPAIQRRSLSHALNIHAVAREVAGMLDRPYEQTRLIVAHLGGGISICPVKGGRIIDANDASSGGPFSTDRTGGLPLQDFITLCFSGERTESEMRRMVMGAGGLVAYLGTNDAVAVEERIQAGDEMAGEVYRAMAYQTAKEIGAMATVLRGEIDAIILTGGLARSQLLTRWVCERVSFIARIIVLPGEFEMVALAEGALRVLRGEEETREYD
jgi:butyrate kinase